MMQTPTEMSLMKQFDSSRGRDELAAALRDHKINVTFKERRQQLHAEKKCPIGKDNKDPVPDFFSDWKQAQHNG